MSFKLPSSGYVIEARCLNVAEQNLLVSGRKNGKRDGSAINEVLSSCILTPGYDSNELLIGDRVALLIHLRALTYGPKFQFRTQCPKCGSGFYWEEDIGELPVTYLDPPLALGETRLYERTLPSSGKAYKFRLLRGKDERLMNKVLDGCSDYYFATMARLIVAEVEGERVLSAQWFNDLPAADLDYILAEWRAADCGWTHSLAIECPKCGWEFGERAAHHRWGFFHAPDYEFAEEWLGGDSAVRT